MPYRFNTKKYLQIETGFWLLVVVAWTSILFGLFDSPQTLFANNWPIIIIAFFSAMIANATAVGGGFIFLPLFTFLYDLSAIQSLKLALSTQAFGMTSGALSWPKHLIIWRYAIFAGLSSGLGMVIGTFIWTPSNETIHVYFGYASIAIGIVLVIEAMQRGASDNSAHRSARRVDKLIFFFVCIAGGMVTAWVSIGIGEIVAMWMLFRARYSIASSVATGVTVLAFCSVLGFAFHGALGGILWDYLIFTVLGVMLGGRAGAKLGATLSRAEHYAKSNYHTEAELEIENTTASASNLNVTQKDPKPTSGRPLKFFVALVILIDGLVVIWLKG